MDTDLMQIISDNYSIGQITCIKPTSSGSGSTYYIETHSDSYIAKINERPDFICIYNKVHSILSQHGFIQSRIIKTKTNSLMTKESIVLYSCLTGNTYNELAMHQIREALQYMRKYNKVLSSIPFAPTEIMEVNCWDKAKSLHFLVKDFRYAGLGLGKSNIGRLDRATQIIKENFLLLHNTKKQLIHADLGPDNFIFNENKVRSIIDFTPEYENEIYSLCQFCYWNYLWLALDNPDLLENWLSIYYQRSVLTSEKKVFYLLLVKASLFRVAGVLLSKKQINPSSLTKRMEALENAIVLYECRKY